MALMLHGPKALATQHPAPDGPGSLQDLPLIVMPSDQSAPDQPMVLLLTGDGGWKGFDIRLCQQLHDKHIPVVALNSLKYFWTKKDPDQTTQVLENLLKRYMERWHKKTFILAGFSFGADVVPFVVNRMDGQLLDSCLGVSLFSPGLSTDFEIHISQMLSEHHQWKYSVVQEIERMRPMNMLCVFGTEEHEFPVDVLQKRHADVVYLAGGHHYENNHDDVAAIVLAHLMH